MNKDRENARKQDKTVLQWHPAFFADIQIELQEDADSLIFENEHQLGTKPMEIDVLVIKKEDLDSGTEALPAPFLFHQS